MWRFAAVPVGACQILLGSTAAAAPGEGEALAEEQEHFEPVREAIGEEDWTRAAAAADAWIDWLEVHAPGERVGQALAYKAATIQVPGGMLQGAADSYRAAKAAFDALPGLEAQLKAGNAAAEHGRLLDRLFRWEEADEVLREAAEVTREAFSDAAGTPYQEVAESLAARTLYYQGALESKLKDYGDAAGHLEASAAMFSALVDRGTAAAEDLLQVRAELAVLYGDSGRLDESEAELVAVQRELEAMVTSGAVGAPWVAATEPGQGARRADVLRRLCDVSNALSFLFARKRQFQDQEEAARESLALLEKYPVPEGKRYLLDEPRIDARVLLALAYQYQGKYAAAEAPLTEVYEECLGRYGPRSHRAMTALNNLGMLRAMAGPGGEAAALATRFLDAMEADLADVLAYFPEPQRLGYHLNRTFSPYDLVATVGDGELVARAVLTFKGAVLDSLARERRLAALAGRTSGAPALLEEIDRARREVFDAHLAGDTGLAEERSDELAGLQRALSEAVRATGGGGALRRVTAAEVREALPPRGVLLEYFYYNKHLGGDGGWEPMVGVVAVRQDTPPVFREVGNAVEVDRSVGQFLSLAGVPAELEGRSQEEITQVLRQIEPRIIDEGGRLWRLLMGPLAGGPVRLGDEVFVAGDGRINLLPFAALVMPSGRFAAEDYDIRYLRSGRELLPVDGFGRSDLSGQNRPAVHVALLVGNPAFGGTVGQLPDAEDEVREVGGSVFGSLPGWGTIVRTGDAATEAAVKSEAEGARVLHFATHGGFPEGLGEALDLRDPMFRSLLLLAGGGEAIGRWRAGSGAGVQSGDDGVLTAAEVVGLDLRAAELVVLSACETGKGETAEGEGVLGLRRGFALAGARNVLVTSWRVDSKRTAEFMVDFYRAALLEEGGDFAGAYFTTLRKRMTMYREVYGEDGYGTIGAVYFAAPFMFSGTAGLGAGP